MPSTPSGPRRARAASDRNHDSGGRREERRADAVLREKDLGEDPCDHGERHPGGKAGERRRRAAGVVTGEGAALEQHPERSAPPGWRGAAAAGNGEERCRFERAVLRADEGRMIAGGELRRHRRKDDRAHRRPDEAHAATGGDPLGIVEPGHGGGREGGDLRARRGRSSGAARADREGRAGRCAMQALDLGRAGAASQARAAPAGSARAAARTASWTKPLAAISCRQP